MCRQLPGTRVVPAGDRRGLAIGNPHDHLRGLGTPGSHIRRQNPGGTELHVPGDALLLRLRGVLLRGDGGGQRRKHRSRCLPRCGDRWNRCRVFVDGPGDLLWFGEPGLLVQAQETRRGIERGAGGILCLFVPVGRSPAEAALVLPLGIRDCLVEGDLRDLYPRYGPVDRRHALHLRLSQNNERVGKRGTRRRGRQQQQQQRLSQGNGRCASPLERSKNEIHDRPKCRLWLCVVLLEFLRQRPGPSGRSGRSGCKVRRGSNLHGTSGSGGHEPRFWQDRWIVDFFVAVTIAVGRKRVCVDPRSDLFRWGRPSICGTTGCQQVRMARPGGHLRPPRDGTGYFRGCPPIDLCRLFFL
mmetsp:Transcript_28498/g.61075  ORF Transcript_28498/g.61075 Transcript_28498/m.61075 type:complete len:355 (-) Transcript_28498:1097-2161(-)